MGLPGAPRMQVLPLSYPRGSAPMRIIAFITEAGSIQVSSHTSVSPPPPRIARAARGPPDWARDFDTRERDTFARSEPLPEYELDQRVS